MPYKCRTRLPVSFIIFADMEPVSTAGKISAARKAQGLSQAKLAELAGVNLRTIQRIEKGETVARGYTLQQIAGALGQPVSYFAMEEPAPEPVNADHLRLLKLLNLSALGFIGCPFGNLIFPLLFWRHKKDVLKEVEPVAARIINFQVLWTVVMSVSMVLTVFVQVYLKLNHYPVPAFALFYVFLFMYLVNIFCILYYSVRLRRGNLNIYPVGIQVF